MVIQLGRAGRDAVGQELADDEAEVGVAGEVGAEGERADLGGVGGRDDDVAAEHEAAEELAGQQHRKGPRKELDKDEAGREDHARGKGVFAPEQVHWVGRDEGSDYLTDGVAH